MTPAPFSAMAWESVQPRFADILVHPFVTGLGDGSLPEAVFVGYLLAGVIIGPGTPGFVADVDVPARLHAGGEQLRLPAEHQVAERSADVVLFGRKRVQRQPHVGDAGAQCGSDLLAIHVAAFDS